MFSDKVMIEDLSLLFGGYQWFRRWIGGRWELWWVDQPVCAQVWHYGDPEDDFTQRPTCICRGVPTIEDYREPRARMMK